MSSRYVLIATIVSVVVVGSYQLRQLQTQSGADVQRSAAAALSVDAAPSVQISKPKDSGIASAEMWNLKPFIPMGQLPSLKDMFKPFYSLDKNGRFEALQRSDRPNERWEFQGVLVREEGLRALFYNPGLKRLKNLRTGEAVDDQLYVRIITPGSVTLESMGEKKPVTYVLRIFNANRDQYVIKKKVL